ncbi:MAG: hypothetical protein JNJ58_02320 [Chitinophagaceae bacterium]|nr:hypothetical protein [Chitinophagaceae bacterium]
MSNPILGILLEYGFHEIKKYIHSGLAKRLATKFDLVWFAPDKGSEAFDVYFKQTGFPVIYLHEHEIVTGPLKIEIRNHTIRKHWMARKRLGAFHNYKALQGHSVLSNLIGQDVMKRFFEQATLKAVRKHYYSESLNNILEREKITHLLMTSYVSGYAKSMAATASKKSIPVNFLVNSWKDIFINNFVPFEHLKNIFVWDDRMLGNYLLHMPYLRSSKFRVTGNPTFDILKQAKPKHSRKDYALKYKIPEQADWFYYTMMPPGLVNDEIETIIALANELLRFYRPDQASILVKLNPNHPAGMFSQLNLPSNVFLTDQYCEYDPEKDMLVQSPEGETEWIDLLLHTRLNLSVPSTVTLEFLTLGKPVINIGFDRTGQKDPRLNQFFEAGFYKPLFDAGKVYKAENLSMFESVLKSALIVNPIAHTMELETLSGDLILSSLIEN